MLIFLYFFAFNIIMLNYELVERLENKHVIGYIMEKNRKAIKIKRRYDLDKVLEHFCVREVTFNSERLKRDDDEIVLYKDLIELIESMPSNIEINPKDVLNFALFSSKELAVILDIFPSEISYLARENKLSYIDVSLAEVRKYHRFLGSRLVLDLRRLYKEEEKRLREKDIVLSREDVASLMVGDLRNRQEKYESITEILEKFFPEEISLERVGRTREILSRMKNENFYTPKEVAEIWNTSVGDVYFHIEKRNLEAIDVSLSENPIYAISVIALESFERKHAGRPKAFTPKEEEEIRKEFMKTGRLRHVNIFRCIAEDRNVSESTIRNVIKRKSFIEEK